MLEKIISPLKRFAKAGLCAGLLALTSGCPDISERNYFVEFGGQSNISNGIKKVDNVPPGIGNSTDSIEIYNSYGRPSTKFGVVTKVNERSDLGLNLGFYILQENEDVRDFILRTVYITQKNIKPAMSLEIQSYDNLERPSIAAGLKIYPEELFAKNEEETKKLGNLAVFIPYVNIRLWEDPIKDLGPFGGFDYNRYSSSSKGIPVNGIGLEIGFPFAVGQSLNDAGKTADISFGLGIYLGLNALF